MTKEEAKEFFQGLSERFTFNELKKAFRAKSFEVHPDTGGTEHEFNQLQNAYDELKKTASHELGEEARELQTVNGTPLTALGKGLPLTVSARECGSCDGLGYSSYSGGKVTVDCQSCKGEGTLFYPCKKCKGTGDYVHSKTNKVIGACFLCGGTGRFYPIFNQSGYYKKGPWFGSLSGVWVTTSNGQKIKVNQCNKCRGKKEVQIDDKKNFRYRKCSLCNGTGEEQIFNPVIPRGFLK